MCTSLSLSGNVAPASLLLSRDSATLDDSSLFFFFLILELQ